MPLFDALLPWIIGNSDPANLVALAAVYWKIRKDHRETRSALETLAEQHPEVDKSEVLPADD